MTRRSEQISLHLNAYLTAHSTPPDAVLRELATETAELYPNEVGLQVAPELGTFLTLLTRLARAQVLGEGGAHGEDRAPPRRRARHDPGAARAGAVRCRVHRCGQALLPEVLGRAGAPGPAGRRDHRGQHLLARPGTRRRQRQPLGDRGAHNERPGRRRRPGGARHGPDRRRPKGGAAALTACYSLLGAPPSESPP